MTDENFYHLSYRGTPEFFVPAYVGKNDQVEELLKKPENMALLKTEFRGQDKQTIIHIACMSSSNLATLKILAANGADINAMDASGRLAIHIAANAADSEILEYLLNGDEDVNQERSDVAALDNNGRSVLHALFLFGSSISEKHFGADKKVDTDKLLKTFRVIESKFNPEKFKELLSTEDKFGISPLAYAKFYMAMYQQMASPNVINDENLLIFESFRKVLDHARNIGMDIDAIADIPLDSPGIEFDYWGRLPIHYNIFNNYLAAVVSDLQVANLINNPTTGNRQFANINSLHNAVLNGSPEMVATILGDQRTNPVSVTDLGSTALHLAAARANLEVLKTLLANEKIKASINTPDIYGMTPLHALAMNISVSKESAVTERKQCIQLLLDNGANIKAKNIDGLTPYEVAVKRGNTAILPNLKIQPQGVYWYLDRFYSRLPSLPAFSCTSCESVENTFRPTPRKG